MGFGKVLEPLVSAMATKLGAVGRVRLAGEQRTCPRTATEMMQFLIIRAAFTP